MNNIHPAFQPIMDMLAPKQMEPMPDIKSIDPTSLDQSRASIKKMLKEMEPQKIKTMILTKKETITKESVIEIAAPAYYVDKWSMKKYKLCEDGALVIINGDLIVRWQEGVGCHEEALAEMIEGIEISENEYMEAFDAAIEAFNKSIYPIPATV
jgi:hypothetical protein